MRTIKNPSCNRCLALNEIGEISQSDSDEAEKARDFLSGLLEAMNPSDRFYAFSYLFGSTELDQETFNKIEEFKTNLDNEDIISQAEAQRETRRS